AALRKNWGWVAAAAVLSTLVATFYTLGETRIYEASATILFDPKPPRPLGDEVQAVVDMGSGNYWNNKEYYKTQYWVIQSRRVSESVVRELNLHKDPGFIDDLPPGHNAPPKEISVEAAASKLRRHLSVEPVKDSQLARVTYQDTDPERAQRVLTVLTETYVRNNLDDTLASSNMATDWLRDQLKTLKSDLEDSEMQLHNYKKKNDILSLSLDDQSNMLREEMKQLNAQLTDVRTKREHVASRYKELRKVKDDDPTSLPARELLESATLQKLREDYVDAKRERDAMIGEGKDINYPLVAAADARASTTKTALLAEVKNIKGTMKRDLSALGSEISGLSGLYKSAKERALELNLLEIHYNRLLRSKENNEKLFGIVLDRTKQGDLTRMLRINNVRLVDRPQLPSRPISPNVPLNILTGLGIGLMLGMTLAFAREQLDRTIKTPDDAEKNLGLAFLGLLPLLSDEHKPDDKRKSRRRRRRDATEDLDHAPELAVHYRPTSGVAEAARSIRTNILFMAPDNPFKTLLITSAGPGEGKTTVSTSIAIAMAQADQKVVLIDCDMRRPRVHRVFGLSNQRGVTTALLEPETLEQSVVATVVPNLFVLPTGPIPPNPSELLHSAAFTRLLSQLQANYARLVIDSPPIVAVTDAAVLSTKVDGTIIIVRAFQTSRDLAVSGAQLYGTGACMVGTQPSGLRESPARLLPVLLLQEEGYGLTKPTPNATPGSQGVDVCPAGTHLVTRSYSPLLPCDRSGAGSAVWFPAAPLAGV
ncbi:MAG: polysaccharide biosynthesis tyrosine autokinase, partial [Polyangiaceae bacterium]